MLTEIQLQEIREHLNRAQNPLFFFDNDADGLCAFLILARYIGRGKGVPIRSFPDLNASYARKIYELKPDYIFVLDKPIISADFIEEVRKMNLPFVWIDHHDEEPENLEGISYYNPNKQKEKSSEPVTYWAWKLSNMKEDLWLAVCGCIGDNFMPEFAEEFKERYAELWDEDVGTAFQALFETDIGKITRVLSFALKDRTSSVVRMLKTLLKTKNPRDILADDVRNHILFRFNQVNKKYQDLLEKVGKFVRGKIVYFQYGGDLSLSADIANELSYRHPGKVVVVAYIKGTKANISLRGKNARKLTEKAIEGLEDATGGGHESATGAKVNVEDLPKFKERIEKLVRD